MSRGDHIYARRGPHYSHHGIDCGDGTVIHYVGDRGSERRIERTSWEEFAGDDKVRVRRHKTPLSTEDIVRNAESRLGTDGYHLVTNNCEHFATWSATGSPGSRQVRKWVMAAPGALASVGVADAAGVHLMIAGTLGMGAYALSKPLRRPRRAESAADAA